MTDVFIIFTKIMRLQIFLSTDLHMFHIAYISFIQIRITVSFTTTLSFLVPPGGVFHSCRIRGSCGGGYEKYYLLGYDAM
jgi:hypothetical protein